MITTDTDVKLLEYLVIMCDANSPNNFEQKKGRGTPTFEHDDLKKITRPAKNAKTYYVPG